jgi:hypothetical protein
MYRLLALLLLLSPPQDRKHGAPSMDYGPFLSASFILKPGAKFDNGNGNFDGPVVARGIAVKLAEGWEAGAIFDGDTLRWAGGWRGGSLKWTGVIFDGAHGPSPTLTVPPDFITIPGPGWSKDGEFADPREDSIPPLPRPGPLPRDHAKYRGLYVHGDQVVLSYTVGKAEVLDRMELEGGAFARTLRVGPSDVRMGIAVADSGFVRAVEKPEGGSLHALASSWTFDVPARPEAVSIRLLLGAREAVDAAAEKSAPAVDLSKLTSGGPARWKGAVETKGVLGKEPGPYVVDRLTLPEKNPWSAKMRPGGLDFFSDGRSAAISTWDGDVWIVSGIDDGLESLTWRRFASGLHQPLGLRIVGDEVYTVGHDQITRLRDLNRDGEADFYECFNSDWELTTAFHSFAFDLQTDRDGNFYFAFNCPVRSGGGGYHRITKHHGTILKVSRDGQRSEIYATGFRANNGIGVGPNGEVTSGDNEGSWVPKCPIHWVKPGSFNGVVDGAHRPLNSAGGRPDPAEEPKPICWMPKNVDNSGGGQVWVTSDRWGPFQGELLHLSYGTSSLYRVLMEEVGGVRQGGVVRLPARFTSSAMRGRFSPKDGQLYVAGLRGWQSNAAREGGLDRVRYTGAPVVMPVSLRVRKAGVEIGFTAPVEAASLGSAEQWAVELWNYRWTSGYGSGDYKVFPDGEETSAKKGKGEGRNRLAVRSAKVAADRKSVLLDLENLQPAHQMRIQFRSAPGEPPLQVEIHNTIHVLGE